MGLELSKLHTSILKSKVYLFTKSYLRNLIQVNYFRYGRITFTVCLDLNFFTYTYDSFFFLSSTPGNDEHKYYVDNSICFPIMSQDVLTHGASKSNKKWDRDTIVPFVLLPLLLVISTISIIITIIVMIFIGMGALYVQSRPRQKNRFVKIVMLG